MKFLTVIASLALTLAPLADAAADTITATTINASQASAIHDDISSWVKDHTKDYSSIASYLVTATDLPTTSVNYDDVFPTSSFDNIQTDFSKFRDYYNSFATLPDSAYDAVPTEVSKFAKKVNKAAVSIVNKDTSEAAGGAQIKLWTALMVGAGVGIALL